MLISAFQLAPHHLHYAVEQHEQIETVISSCHIKTVHAAKVNTAEKPLQVSKYDKVKTTCFQYNFDKDRMESHLGQLGASERHMSSNTVKSSDTLFQR